MDYHESLDLNRYRFSGETLSCWTEEKPYLPRFTPELKNSDVCVIGAGIVGISTAFLLQEEGRRVTVIDSADIGSGQTSRTTAHLAWAMDDGLGTLIKYHGRTKAREIVQSHRLAVQRIEDIVQDQNINCDFHRLNGYLFLQDDGDVDKLKKERDAYHELGFTDVEYLGSSPISLGPCLEFKNQGQFNPLQYLFKLAEVIENSGGRFLTNNRVAEVEYGPRPNVILEDGTRIQCNAVVVATNAPINSLVRIPLKQAPYRTYALSATIPKGVIPKALFWDTEDPYHYIRMKNSFMIDGHDEIIVGGEDHKVGQDAHPERHMEALERWTRKILPSVVEITHRWSGQVWEPVDKIAYIGRAANQENVYMATGDSGQGMTHGTIAAHLLTDLILGRSNHLEYIYDPERVTIQSTAEFLSENLNVARQYTEYFTPAEVKTIEAIPNGEGAVLRDRVRPVAVFKKMDGSIISRSAICRHLGCIVHWNTVEKSWDCPCHGSRYSCTGQVITGPAHDALKSTDHPHSVQHPPMH